MLKTVPISNISPGAYKKFSCGVQELDGYLYRFAKNNHRKGIGKTFLLMDKEEVVGFYTISMGSIEFQNLPSASKQGIPKYPIPVARIGRLAISFGSQGKKYGKILLIDALQRIYFASESVAAYAIIVDAKDDRAKQFYEHFGFIPLDSPANSLFLPTGTAKDLFESK